MNSWLRYKLIKVSSVHFFLKKSEVISESKSFLKSLMSCCTRFAGDYRKNYSGNEQWILRRTIFLRHFHRGDQQRDNRLVLFFHRKLMEFNGQVILIMWKSRWRLENLQIDRVTSRTPLKSYYELKDVFCFLRKVLFIIDC